ncbi:hypothetical protein PHYBLDRAFT_169622 [Phycomyces blakesleeanus NRRL 1555(-)]|uniref:Uncharacterized protein n=1 Tax=Phycomyces blakesleeanus (strain ATCC 8743b / DSM 1359 / FGSC 10004 / NBRC 33097 / NRRL 1555) TaxID=763407 RepID=A0A167MCW9_PHYB8|nr:hypothetical protein PHYBLDRAFT_169622 [Phycomyces blakesleeanus NRRL 1555(-)]OAD72494.1 hypothetical protein PHYBLDRAFT_169622 [Phycomyces blakesleeanus NRRL 1555(-)]|eukprot:XP_018290534.1 hypothetical protein PHYBLDRAFT_169622 [Phycomyces blakesleeanus NRRL 1555(-)]
MCAVGVLDCQDITVGVIWKGLAEKLKQRKSLRCVPLHGYFIKPSSIHSGLGRCGCSKDFKDIDYFGINKFSAVEDHKEQIKKRYSTTLGYFYSYVITSKLTAMSDTRNTGG